MAIRWKIIKNTYRDSITLMRVARDLNNIDGVEKSEVLVGSPANIEALKHSGMFHAEINDATINDIIVVFLAESDEIAELGFLSVDDQLLRGKQNTKEDEREDFNNLSSALRFQPNANLVLMSIPGPFVKSEALRAIKKGLNLMIFSDNVPISDEVEIKQLAESNNLLVMGPDCGTAIISGGALGFANSVRRGSIGIVAASGTGLQEVSSLIDRAGYGISQAIGTGSNDVKDLVGGVTLTRGIRMLEEDINTDVIVVITKPPQPKVKIHLKELVASLKKPVVINLIGEGVDELDDQRVKYASTLEETAKFAVELVGGIFAINEGDTQKINSERKKLSADQKFVRGLFAGGTFAAESACMLSECFDNVYTNFPLRQSKLLPDKNKSVGHVCLDLGDDFYTQGKPHPMLDPIMRKERILYEASDPETAVLLLDFVLGYGVHPDPVGEIIDTLIHARAIAETRNQYLPIIASVCGTKTDPQNWEVQVEKLISVGVLVFSSNSQATDAVCKLLL